MSQAGDRAQVVMDEAYGIFREQADWSSRYLSDRVDGRHAAVTLLGNMHYQVENGGPGQWWDNGYAHAKGPGGRTAAEAIQVLTAMHAEADPEVADVFGLIASRIAAAPDPRAPQPFVASRDEDDEDYDPLDDEPECAQVDAEVLDAFDAFGQERRMAFLDAVADRHDPSVNPFLLATPTAADGRRGRSGRYPSTVVRLVGEDGNAFAMIARTRRALRKDGVAEDEIERFTEEAKAGGYDGVIATIMRWVATDVAPGPRR